MKASIAVITATYNAARVLPGLIESLRAQSWRGFEWIVVDGGSTDGTVQLLQASADVVTHWISEPDHGIYDALNKALRAAQSDYYVVLGADDRLLPKALESYQRAAGGSADIISAPVLCAGRQLVPKAQVSMWRSEPPRVSAHSVGACIRRSLHDQFGLYSRRFPIAADTYFLLQVHKAGKRFTALEECAGEFGTSGLSSTDVLGGLTESMRAHAEVRGMLPLHLLLFGLRVLKNWGRLGRGG